MPIEYSHYQLIGSWNAYVPLLGNSLGLDVDAVEIKSLANHRYGASFAQTQAELMHSTSKNSTLRGVFYACRIGTDIMRVVGEIWDVPATAQMAGMDAKMPHITPSLIVDVRYTFAYDNYLKTLTWTPQQVCVFNGSILGTPDYTRFAPAYWEGSAAMAALPITQAIELAESSQKTSMLAVNLPSNLPGFYRNERTVSSINSFGVQWGGVTKNVNTDRLVDRILILTGSIQI